MKKFHDFRRSVSALSYDSIMHMFKMHKTLGELQPESLKVRNHEKSQF